MLSVSIQKVNKATDPLDSTITYAVTLFFI